MSRSKTIQIFLKDAESDGIKIAELSNSIAKVFVVPRSHLDFVKSRSELSQPALYMLFDDERTSVYIGECENFAKRVKDHEVKKDFWQWVVVCTTHGTSLNKAHVKYLESIAVQLSIEVGRFEIQNRTHPIENTLHEFDQASIFDYFEDVKLLLSTLGFNVFDPIKVGANTTVLKTFAPSVTVAPRSFDTIVSPCSKDGFQNAFVKENAWWAVRIGESAIPKLKYVALYESAPISAIRAYAKITKIEAYPDKPGKYIIHHDGDIMYLDNPVNIGANSNLSLQGSRYYLLEDIKTSKTLGELTNKAFGTKFKD